MVLVYATPSLFSTQSYSSLLLWSSWWAYEWKHLSPHQHTHPQLPMSICLIQLQIIHASISIPFSILHLLHTPMTLVSFICLLTLLLCRGSVLGRGSIFGNQRNASQRSLLFVESCHIIWLCVVSGDVRIGLQGLVNPPGKTNDILVRRNVVGTVKVVLRVSTQPTLSNCSPLPDLVSSCSRCLSLARIFYLLLWMILTLRNHFGCVKSSVWKALLHLSRTHSLRWYLVSMRCTSSPRTLIILLLKPTQAPPSLVATVIQLLWCLILVLLTILHRTVLIF